jgi:ATP-binding cassette, subfamily B, bacterial
VCPQPNNSIASAPNNPGAAPHGSGPRLRAAVGLLRYARSNRTTLLLISVLTLLTAGLAALQPWPLKLLVDHVLGDDPLPGWLHRGIESIALAPTSTTLIALIVIGGLLLFLLNSALDAGLAWSWTRAGRRMVNGLAQDMFARLQRRALSFHSRARVGDIIARITGDSWCVYQVVVSLVFAPAHALVTIAVMLVLMAQLSLPLTGIALGLAPFMVAASFLLGQPLRAAAKLKREIESRIQAHIQQTLTGIPVVQAFAQEEREQQRFQDFAAAAIRTQQRSALLSSVNSLTSGFVTTLGSGVILWVGARQVLDGRLTLGAILVFLVYLTSLQAQMKILAGLYPTYQTLSASIQRVSEVLVAAPELVEPPGAVALPPLRGEVRFENVTAGYEAGQPVLRDISFTAHPGETIAIVGATGTGKTTLVNLIPRFADPSAGRVRLDGYDVREVQLQSLRGQMAVVWQESLLLPVSIAENIALGARPQRAPKSRPPPARHLRTSSSPVCRKVMTQSSVNAAQRCPAVSGNGLPLRGPCCASRPSSFSTNPPARLMPKPRPRLSPHWKTPRAGPPPLSSRTGWPPFATRIAFSCCTKVAWWRAGRMMNCWRDRVTTPAGMRRSRLWRPSQPRPLEP